MLDSLYIKNFRLFKELKIERLGRVNLFVGKNNSGKTGLLEALWLYATHADMAVLAEIISRREEYWKTETHQSLPIEPFPTVDKNSCKYLFYGYQIPRQNDTSHCVQIGSLEPPDNRLELVCDGASERQSVKVFPTDNHDKGVDKLNVQFLSTIPMAEQEIESLWNNIIFTPLEEFVVKGLRLVDSSIQRIGLIRNSSYQNQVNIIPIVVCENYQEPFSLKHLGEGMNRVFQILLSLVNAREGFLLIDEFENGLHYSVQPKVWEFILKLAKDLNVQVFATTHSWDCVTAFQQASQNSEQNAMLFRLGRSVRKSDNGKVIAIEYDKEDLQVVSQAQLEIRG
jgi:AAA15 family ATPase/GTPase